MNSLHSVIERNYLSGSLTCEFEFEKVRRELPGRNVVKEIFIHLLSKVYKRSIR